MSKEISNIQQELRRIRTEQGLTQKQLAEASGLTQAKISHIELGDNDMKLTTIEKVADALGYNIVLQRY